MRKRAEVEREIRSEWSRIAADFIALGGRPEAANVLPKSIKLFGQSVKVDLGAAKGVDTAVIYMAPARESGVNLCPWAGSCAGFCLGHSSGRLAMAPGKRARLWKSALWIGAPDLFVELAEVEARAFAEKANRAGLIPALRVDGSSDIGLGGKLARLVPGVQWYDYTKSFERADRNVSNPDWTVVYSASENSDDQSIGHLLRKGGRVSMVFDVVKGAPLPEVWNGHTVVDGDEHDAVFLQPKGVILGLRFKASKRKTQRAAAATRSGFVASSDLIELEAA